MKERIPRRFIAWDGEGIGTGKDHRYIMVCNSEGDSLVNLEGITFPAFIAWMDSVWKESWSTAIHVGFAIGYDVNMLLTGDSTTRIGRTELYQLWTEGHTILGPSGTSATRVPGVEVRYRHRKELCLYRYSRGERYSKWHNAPVPCKIWEKNKDGTIRAKKDWVFRLWDTFSFFQTNFITACRKNLPEADMKELDFIEGQKKKRGTEEWNEHDVPTMQAYCIMECKYLVRLMEHLAGSLETAKLYPNRWDGAGALATALLKRQRIKQHISPSLGERLGPPVQQAYAGGRIEAYKYGHLMSPIYTYDVVSAYPSAMLRLRSQVNRQMRNVKGMPANHVKLDGLYHIRWEYPQEHPFYAFFWRDKQGRIFFPQRGQGWYYGHEIQAACTHSCDIQVYWGIEPVEDTVEPFSFLTDLFQQRKRWKINGDGAEKVLKLAMNSLYGKLAQQIGWTEGKPPPYFSLYWAGLITSTIRARLYAAMMTNPDAIIYAATDGIASTARLPLTTGNKLGDWECTEYAGITLVQAGVYWLYPKEGPPIAKYRGFDKGSLSPEAIIASWEAGDDVYKAPSTRFVGMGSALANQDHLSRWRQWITIERELSLYPQGKRGYREKGEPWKGLVANAPTTPHTASLHESAPFVRDSGVLEPIDAVPPQTYYDEEEYGIE